MTPNDAESIRRPSAATSGFSAGRRPRGSSGAANAAIGAIAATIAAALVLSACSSGHKTAKTSPSGVASVASSAPPAAVSSAAVSSAAPVSSAPATAVASPVSSIPPGVVTADFEAPATKAGFVIRLHRGLIIKVDPQQAAAGKPVTFTLSPATTTFLTPIAGHDGYYKGVTDGVATVIVSQGGTPLGTIAITVWG